MRGHVRKRGRTWSVVVELGHDGTGRRRQQWRGGFATRKEAERRLAEMLQGLHTGGYVPPSRQTVADFLQREWLPTVRGTVRPTTMLSYEMYVRRYLVPRLGSTPLQRLSGAALNAFYSDLVAKGRADGSGGLSPATVRRIHAVVHRAMRDAVRWERLARNPADLADPPRQGAAARREMTTWTAEEVERFLAYSADDRLFGLWVLLLTTGLRRGEALGLRWQDVDLDSGRIAVTQTRVTVGHDVQVTEPKTARSRRVVAIDPGTIAALRSHRKVQLEERLAWGGQWQDSGLVFVREDGAPLHPNRASKLFEALVRSSGLPRIRLHDTRHTHATLALRAGIHAKVVSDRLGHSTTSLTLDVYSHAVPGLQEEAAARVAALFLKPPAETGAGSPA